MISSGTLAHSKVRESIFNACLNVYKSGYSVDHVTNRDGQAYIAIRKGSDGKIMATDRNGRDVSKPVREVIQAEVNRLRKKHGVI